MIRVFAIVFYAASRPSGREASALYRYRQFPRKSLYLFSGPPYGFPPGIFPATAPRVPAFRIIRRSRGAREPPDVKAGAIVLHVQAQHAVGEMHADIHLIGAGMFADIVAAFLYKPVDNNLGLLRQRLQFIHLQLHAAGMEAAEAFSN